MSFVGAVIVSLFVIRQSSYFRWFGYETIPIPITDEFNYVWQGISLRRYGLPLGWTTLIDGYSNPQLQTRQGVLDGFGISIEGKLIDLDQFRIDPRPITTVAQIDYMKGMEHMYFVAPFFDHPPLGGLIYSLGVDRQVVNVDEVEPADFRKPALGLAIVSSVLLFLLLYLITTNPWVGTLAVIIYSTVPTYLLASRMSFLENTVIPFILAHLVLLVLTARLNSKSFSSTVVYILAFSSGLVGGASVLTKESAIGFLFGSLILLAINKVRKKAIILFLIGLLLPILGYLVWGYWLQKNLFLEILTANSNRGYFGAIKLVAMLEALKFKNFPIDGWWVWGFISLLMVSINVKNKYLLFVTIPLFTHLLTVLLLGSHNYPWYFIACIPLLAACSSLFIWQIIEHPTIASSMAFFLIPFSSSYYWGRNALNLQPSINHYRYAFFIFGILLTLRLVYKKYKLFQLIWLVFFAILINKIIVFNQVFFPYLVAHWGNLPISSLPNF